MKRTLALSLILAALVLPLQAVEWTSDTTGDQSVSENVIVSGTAPVGNITFNGSSEVSGTGSIGGDGNITVNSGTVVFDGVSRPDGSGNITVASGATLEIKNGARLLKNTHNSSSVVTVNGTLKVENLAYGGSLGSLHDNVAVSGYTDSLVLNGSESADESPRVEITESGSATIGARLNGYGRYFTFAVSAGKDFSWNASGNGNVVAQSGAGSVLVIEAGMDATFSLGKNIGTGLTINKTGEGTLVLNSTLNIDSGRRINISSGTVKFGANAAISSAGDGFYVNEEATMDLEGKAGISGQAVTVTGSVINGQNNEMTITLGENGSFSISGDATSGYNGSLVLAEGASIDLGGYVFYNSIDVSAGGELLNAQNHRGSIMLGVDDEGITHVDSDKLSSYGSSLASSGSIEVSLTENFSAETPDFGLLRGRLYASDSLSITGAGEESVSVSGYQSEYGALSAQNGDISITNVLDVTLSNNEAGDAAMDDYNRAGALSATGNVTVEAAGDIVVSGNSAMANYTSAGAIYAGGDLSLSGASISIAGNSVGGDAQDSFSGGALKSDYGVINLTSSEGDIDIVNNSAAESGGALYSSGGVEIISAGDVTITGNSTGISDGGAIYSDGDVTLTPGDGGTVTISNNTAGNYDAGGNGGAIFSNGTVYMSGGTFEVSGNSAGSYGGAIYAESVEISADAGNITFSGNSYGEGVANDVELCGGTAALSASNGYTLEMQGGVTCAGEIAISTDADSAVKLGGSSSTENLTVESGRLLGVTDAEGNMAVINVSTCVTLSDALIQDVILVDEYAEAVWTSTSSTYVYNDAISMLFETLGDDSVNCTSSATLLSGFAVVGGDLSIGISQALLSDVLAGADGAAVNISLTLLEETSAIDEELGSFTFKLDETLASWLESANLDEYGFYDEEGNLLGITEVQLTEAGNVVFMISGLNAVPEPATTTLSLLALSSLCVRRRRRC